MLGAPSFDKDLSQTLDFMHPDGRKPHCSRTTAIQPRHVESPVRSVICAADRSSAPPAAFALYF